MSLIFVLIKLLLMNEKHLDIFSVKQFEKLHKSTENKLSSVTRSRDIRFGC